MPGFDMFRARSGGYVPRTPAAALKAIGVGLLPVEPFVYASTSVKPLDEEPFDLDAIEQMLARTNLDPETTARMKSILEKLISSDDQETALFGAEGINTLEGRFINRIEKLKSIVAEALPAQLPPEGSGSVDTPGGGTTRQRGALREIARQYHGLAMLHGRGSSIRAFYLREAFRCLRRAHETGRIPRADLTLMIDILISLGLHGQAARLLRQVRAAEDPTVLLLSARVAFHRGKFTQVADFCRRLAPLAGRLGTRERKAVAFWAGEQHG